MRKNYKIFENRKKNVFLWKKRFRKNVKHLWKINSIFIKKNENFVGIWKNDKNLKVIQKSVNQLKYYVFKKT